MEENLEGSPRYEIDPERQRALEEFRRIENQVFIPVPEKDQKTAKAEYEAARTKYYGERVRLESMRAIPPERKRVILRPGSVVVRGGVLQRIGQPFEIEVANVGRDAASSKQLPDGSVVYFTDMSYEAPPEEKGP